MKHPTTRPAAPFLFLAALASRPAAAPVPFPKDPAAPDVAAPELWRTLHWVKGRHVVVSFDPRGRLAAVAQPAKKRVEVRSLPDGRLLQTLEVQGIHGQ